MAEAFPDKIVDILQLNDEIAALNLPDFVGVGRLSRSLDTGTSVQPFLYVKVGSLSGEQRASLQMTITNHLPDSKAPTRKEELLSSLEAEDISYADLVELLKSMLV